MFSKLGETNRNRVLRLFQSLKRVTEASPVELKRRANERTLYRHLLGARPGTIFDVGANLGSVSAQLHRYFPDASIHAFEPDPNVFAMLERRFRSNARVQCLWCGVGNQRGEIPFNVNTVSATNSFLDIDAEAQWSREMSGIVKPVRSINVPITTLDKYCEAQSIGRVAFIKADIQGYEPQMLEGAQQLLGEQKIDILKVELVFEEFYSAISDYDVIRPLLGPNYRLWSFEHLNVRPSTGKLLFCDAIFVSKRRLKELEAR